MAASTMGVIPTVGTRVPATRTPSAAPLRAHAGADAVRVPGGHLSPRCVLRPGGRQRLQYLSPPLDGVLCVANPPRVWRFNARLALSLEAGREETGLPFETPDTAPLPDQVAETGELRSRVRRAVACLPMDYREVVVLHDTEGMKLEDIARATGVPVGTVKSRLSRGRAQIKRALTP